MLKSFFLFWWDFIVGDDWVVAAGVVVALSCTHLCARADINAWWLLPVAVVVLLAASLWRGLPARSPRSIDSPPSIKG